MRRCASRCSIATTTICSSRCCTRWRRRRCRPATSRRRSAGFCAIRRTSQVLLADVRGDRRHALRRRSRRRSAATRSPYDYLIVATGAAHAYFGHPEWAARAPGLKTLDDALEMQAPGAAGVRSGRARDRSRGAAAPADVRHRRRRADRRRAGGRARGDRAPVAARGLPPHPPRVGAHHPARGRARTCSATFPGSAARRARASRSSGSASTCAPASIVTGVDRRRRDVASACRADAPSSDRGADRAVGRRRRGVAARDVARRAARSRRPRPGRADAGRSRASARSSSSATSARSQQDGQPLPGRRAGRDAGGRARRAEHPARHRGASRSSRSATATTATWRRSAAARRSSRSARSSCPGSSAWLFWIFLHIFWLIGFRNRVAVMSEWAWAYLTFQRRVRLITGGKLWPDA